MERLHQQDENGDYGEHLSILRSTYGHRVHARSSGLLEELDRQGRLHLKVWNKRVLCAIRDWPDKGSWSVFDSNGAHRTVVSDAPTPPW